MKDRTVAALPLRVIFLDVDGVLNSRRWFMANAGKTGKRSTLGEIDPDAAARVQRLVDETGARIVVSSTWRLLYQLHDLRRMFEARGLHAPLFDRTPPTIGDRRRGDDIQAWLDEHHDSLGIEGMVILDDDSDMKHLKPWLVQTTFEHGLTDDHVTRAVEMLARAMPEVRRAG